MVFDSSVVMVFGILQAQQRLLRCHFHRLLCRRDGEREVERHRAPHLDRNRLRGLRREPACPHSHRIGSGIDLREEKPSVCLGLFRANGLGVDLGGRDFRIGQRRTRCVQHRARDRARCAALRLTRPQLTVVNESEKPRT